MKKKLAPGIYVHLPFCSVHCTYCDFPITTRTSLSNRYYDALLKELHVKPAQERADTLYFGGGTPSLAPVPVLQEIVSSVSIEPKAEITMEVNPDHVTAQKLADWRSLGINRLSLGVQSLEKDVLQRMLRQHSPQDALNAIQLSAQAGFENRSIDLILGFPNQTVSGFLSGLQQLIECEPDHFSIYLLEIHEGTGLHKIIQSGGAVCMEEEAQIGCFETAIDLLAGAGFEQYEVSNFARKKKMSIHNLKYWTDAPYYAYGAGACSYFERYRTRNIPDVQAYIEAMERGASPVDETIQEDPETRARNALIFGLRKIEGVHVEDFEAMYGRSAMSLFDDDLDSHFAGGLLERVGHHLRLTRKGLLLANEVLTSAIG